MNIEDDKTAWKGRIDPETINLEAALEVSRRLGILGDFEGRQYDIVWKKQDSLKKGCSKNSQDELFCIISHKIFFFQDLQTIENRQKTN